MTRKKFSKKHTRTAMYVMLTTFTVAILIAGSVYLQMSINLINRYASLAATPNPACEGLALELERPSTIRATFSLNATEVYGEATKYDCLVGEFTTDKVIHGKPIDAYEFGASAIIFEDEVTAETYAEKVIKPMRNWGVGEESGPDSEIEQSDNFTFLVTDEEWPYYDAYTQHSNAVYRISMPCHDDDIKRDGVACYAQAETAIEDFVSRISSL